MAAGCDGGELTVQRHVMALSAQVAPFGNAAWQRCSRSNKGASVMSVAPDPPAAPRPNSIVGEAGKWLALIGSIIAAGQAGTTWLRGYWQAEAEKQKSAQELALAGLKDKSELAQQYLKVILDKETKPSDRAILYTALGKLEGHPLQKWALEQYSEYQKNLTKLLEAYGAQSDAAQLHESAKKRVALLSAELKALEMRIELVRDDPDQRQTLQNQRISKSGELEQAEAEEASAKQAELLTATKKAQESLNIQQTTFGASNMDPTTMMMMLMMMAKQPNEVGKPDARPDPSTPQPTPP
jgi:hypothetical protein